LNNYVTSKKNGGFVSQLKDLEISNSIPQVKLKDLACILQGNQFRSKMETTPEGDSFVIQMKNILQNKTIDYHNLSKINSAGIHERFFVHQGDVLLVNRGMNVYSSLVDQEVASTIAAGHFFILRMLSSQIIPSILNSFINQPLGQKLLKHYQIGSSVLMLPRKAIEDLVIPVPPLEIQEKLAKLYELQIREFDLMQQLMERKQVFLNRVFNLKLNNV
jgi:restriction endonuclease S subunit